jgi:hypothetical protein
MRRIGLAVILSVSLILAPLTAQAQAGKVYQIGFWARSRIPLTRKRWKRCGRGCAI